MKSPRVLDRAGDESPRVLDKAGDDSQITSWCWDMSC